MATIEFSNVRPLHVDMALATKLHEVGNEAWQDEYAGVWSPEIIRRRFEIRSTASVEQAIREYQIACQIGALSVATLPDRRGERVPIGFAVSYNELAMDPVHRLQDRLRHPFKHSHVLLAELNVLPEFQGRGVGRELIRRSLTYFNRQKVPSAWVLEEGASALGLLTKLGYSIAQQTESTKRQGLGPLGPLTSEHYFTAPSVGALRRAIHSNPKRP